MKKLLALLIAAVLTSTALGTDRLVPSQYTTIQQAIDDAGELRLNENVISSLSEPPPQNWNMLHSFDVSAGSSYLNQGLNTLTIKMTYSDNYVEGVRLEGTAIPEPATVCLLGLGALSLI
jgi:hypothetical protein